MEIKLPISVQYILDRLQSAGFEGYVVGGCVRDSLMNKIPHDWDICTNALPEQVTEIFKDKKVIPTGIKHGTVTVLLENYGISYLYEITTYRKDGKYSDGRHPDNVEFVPDLKEDLSRRDFTINAMAYNPQKGLIDFFGGRNDLENRIIKCVGTPKHRFSEDALRIMRAVRFAMTLGFTIEANTQEAMDELAGNLKQISIERINSELCKILAEPLIYSNYRTPSFELFADELILFRTLVCYLNIVNSKIQIPLVSAFSRLWYCGEEQNYPLNLVLVFDSPNIEEILEDLRFSKETILTAKEIYDFGHKIYDEIDEWRKCWLPYYTRKLLNRICRADYNDILIFAKSLCNSSESLIYYSAFAELENELDIRYKNNDVYKLNRLAINGNDLMKLGFKGREIGIMLDKLLDLVMQDKVKNTYEDLTVAIGQVIDDVQL